MKRSEFIARVAGGRIRRSTAGTMTDEGPFAATEIQIERPGEACRRRRAGQRA